VEAAKVPAAHAAQSVGNLAPLFGWYVPASQLAQSVMPATFW